MKNKITRGFNKLLLQAKKHSPAILITVGTVGVVASTVMACKATLKVNDVLGEAKDEIDNIKETRTEQESKKELAVTYVKTGVELTKLYAPSVLLGTLSLSCIISSHNIMKKRNVALASAYSLTNEKFKKYRDGVIERFGQRVDKEIKYGLKQVEIEEIVKDENGNEVKVKKQADVVDPLSLYSPYARFYDDGNKGWVDDSEYNLMTLRAQQAYANDLLKANGCLFLNEVYDLLGIPRTKEGQVVGWLYNPKDKTLANCVDFGIYDIYKPGCRDFVNGYEKAILLDFNVDGNIYDMM